MVPTSNLAYKLVVPIYATTTLLGPDPSILSRGCASISDYDTGPRANHSVDSHTSKCIVINTRVLR